MSSELFNNTLSPSYSTLNTQHSKLALALIVVAYLVLATIYSVVVPLGEGPDEPGHAAYAYFLAREGRLPVQRYDPRFSDVRGEGHQPPLAYGVMALTLLWLPRAERSFDLPGNARFVWSGGDEVNAVGHGSREFWPWSCDVLAWHIARLTSVALGAATVGFTYLAAKQFVDERRRTNDEGLIATSVARRSSFVPLAAAALVAFNPQFLFTSALLTNDALLIALSAALLWMALRSNDERRTTNDERRTTNDEQRTTSSEWRAGWRNAAAMGVVLGLALITKQSALVLVPVALLGSLRRKQWSKTRDAGLCSFVPVFLVFGIAALISGWWYWRNWQLYGDPLGLSAFTAEFTTQPFERGDLRAWLGALWQLHASFWARFGWMNVAPPRWVTGAYTLLVLAAVIGLGVRSQGSGVRWFASRIPHLASERWKLALLLFFIGLSFAWVVSFAFTAGLVAWQGRLMFPALPAVAIVLALGFMGIRDQGSGVRGQGSRLTKWLVSAGLLVAVGYCVLAIWLPFGTIQAAYPRYTLPESAAFAQIGTPVYGRFGEAGDPGVELRGWQVDGALHPGTALDMSLIWHALGRQRRDWSVFVHLVDARGETITGINGAPNGNTYPMKQWVADDWVADRRSLPLPADLPLGTYTVRVGLFNEQGDGGRAGRFDEKGQLRGDSLDIGQITVTR